MWSMWIAPLQLDPRGAILRDISESVRSRSRMREILPAPRLGVDEKPPQHNGGDVGPIPNLCRRFLAASVHTSHQASRVIRRGHAGCALEGICRGSPAGNTPT